MSQHIFSVATWGLSCLVGFVSQHSLCVVTMGHGQGRHKSPVTIENSLSRQTSQCFLSQQRNLCHNIIFKDSYRDRGFVVATNSARLVS